MHSFWRTATSCLLSLPLLAIDCVTALSSVRSSRFSSSSSSYPQSVTADVVLVGAGPAGLVLGHALRDRGYDVHILERRPSFAPVGSAVFLHPFAINSVRAISPTVAENLIRTATPMGTVSVKSLTNERNSIVFHGFDNASDVFGAPFVVIKFWDMLQALKMGLPEDIFSYGHNVVGFDVLDDGRIQLQCDVSGVSDGKDDMKEEEFKHITAKTVIDAGGIRSLLRKQLVPDTKSVPKCKAYMSVAPADKVKEILDSSPLSERELSFYSGDIDAMTVSTLKNGDVWWTYTYFDDDLDGSLGKGELVERMKSRFPQFLSKLIEATDDYLEVILADLTTTWKWGSGNVTLLGDSAHAQLPSLGLGCSTAFADIEELCRQIDQLGLQPEAFRWYERMRMPQTAFLQWASRLAFTGVRFLGKQKEKQ